MNGSGHKPEQMLLFSSDVEDALMTQSSRFRQGTDDQRRYVLAFLRLIRDEGARVPSPREVGAEAGFGKTKAYEISRDPEVCSMLREAAQAHSDVADVIGSLAYDELVKRLFHGVMQRTITPQNISPAALKLLQDSKARMGLAPQLGATAGVMLPDGTTVFAGASTGGDEDLTAVLGELRSQQLAAIELAGSETRTVSDSAEQGSAESVRGADFLPEDGVRSGAEEGTVPGKIAKRAALPAEIHENGAAAVPIGEDTL